MTFKYLDIVVSHKVEPNFKKILEQKITFINNKNIMEDGITKKYTAIDETQIEIIADNIDEEELISKYDGDYITQNTLDFAINNLKTEIYTACNLTSTISKEQLCYYKFNNNYNDELNNTDNLFRGWMSFDSTNKKEGTHSLNPYGACALDIYFKNPLKDIFSVSFWIRKGFDKSYLFGGEKCGLKSDNNKLGFTTGNNDLFGVELDDTYKWEWIHIGVIFKNYNIEESKLYINGIEQTLTKLGKKNPIDDDFKIDEIIRLSGWLKNNSYRVNGNYDLFKVYNKELTSAEFNEVMNEDLT